MFFNKNKAVILSLFLLISFVVPGLGQQNNNTPSQRLDIMRQKLETMRRSLSSAASVLKDDTKDDKSKKDDKNSLETPLGRLKSLEKETSNLQSEVNTTRGKVDRSEK